MELKRETRTVDLSSEVEVLTYTNDANSPREVIARVDLGTALKPLSGVGGAYQVNFYLDGILVAPVSSIIIPVGETRSVIVSRAVPLELDDVVSIRVVGQSADTDVTVVTTLRDGTPLRVAEYAGGGPILVDHNYGGTDKLAYILSNGRAIDNATIWAYLACDYDQGRTSRQYVQGESRTNNKGRWVSPMMLDAGNYKLVFFVQGQYGPNVKKVTVE